MNKIECKDCGRYIDIDDAIIFKDDDEKDIILCSDCAEFDLFESMKK
jgi:NAD-dependent SIR2 family protein deacetylase